MRKSIKTRRKIMTFGFDLTQVVADDNQSGALPAGQYTVVVERADMTNTKDGSGKYVKLMLRVCDMEKRNNAVIFENINVVNASEAAQDIGRKRIKSMLELIGMSEDQQKAAGPLDLIGKKFSVFVKVESNGQYGEENKIVSYSAAPSGVKHSEPEKQSDATGGKWI